MLHKAGGDVLGIAKPFGFREKPAVRFIGWRGEAVVPHSPSAFVALRSFLPAASRALQLFLSFDEVYEVAFPLHVNEE